jgi:hypothetical protein
LAFLPPSLEDNGGYEVQRQISFENWTQDLYLMHHYSTSACSTFSSDEQITTVWRDYIISQATQHSFLMHGLLAFSAAHLRYVESENSRKWATICSQHHNCALPGFRAALINLSEENCKAVFSMAALCSTMSMANLSHHTNGDPVDTSPSLEDIIQLFVLTKGVRDVLTPAWEFIVSSPLIYMRNGSGMQDYHLVSLPDDIVLQFQRLRAIVDSHCVDDSSKMTCSTAITDLEKCFKGVAFQSLKGVNEAGILLKWTTMVSPGYISMMRQRQVPALVILAHWVVVMGWLKHWYLQGWSRKAWNLVILEIPESPTINQCLEWPKRQLDEGLPAFSPRE